MKSLLVSPWRPWPETWGTPIRLANIAHGLARTGEVDLFVTAEGVAESPLVAPGHLKIGRAEEVTLPPRSSLSMMRRLGWLTSGSMPRIFVARNYEAVRSMYHSWATNEYDLVWFYTVECWVALHQVIDAAKVVDLDQLNDYTMEDRLALEMMPHSDKASSVSERLRNGAALLQTRKEIHLWRQLYAALAASVESVVVCRELDRRRLGVKNVFVIPNGYDNQSQPAGRSTIGHPPTIVFPGLFTYAPNVDAATYLAREIVPLIRRKIPSVQIRLVGEPDESVQKLHNPPVVIVTHFVPDIRTELAKADLIAVPERFGGGTRVKILEAFAHRIPVVSTAIGAEGIEARHGREIFIGSTPADFAEACVRLLSDNALRGRVVDAAHTLFLNKYRWDHIQGMIASLATRIVHTSSR